MNEARLWTIIIVSAIVAVVTSAITIGLLIKTPQFSPTPQTDLIVTRVISSTGGDLEIRAEQIILSDFSGSGEGYVCVNAEGSLFRSSSPCV